MKAHRYEPSRSTRGITVPLVTPFEPESDVVDEPALEELVDHLLENGVDAVLPCGTTGEFASLTDGAPPGPRGRSRARRRRGAGARRRGRDERPETVDYLEEAADLGADGAVIVPPYFHTANDPAGNRRFFEAVADESPLPLLVYNIPACTGGRIEPRPSRRSRATRTYSG